MLRRVLLAAALAGFAGWAAPVAAQSGAADELQSFLGQVARAWAAADVDGLIARTVVSHPLSIDTGSGAEASTDRHAAAALRDLFDARETLAVTPRQVTLAGSDPATGFGEFSWAYRDRGAPGDQVRSVYVAAVQEGGAWRISELRLLP